jgi:hypothetical protein
VAGFEGAVSRDRLKIPALDVVNVAISLLARFDESSALSWQSQNEF